MLIKEGKQKNNGKTTLSFCVFEKNKREVENKKQNINQTICRQLRQILCSFMWLCTKLFIAFLPVLILVIIYRNKLKDILETSLEWFDDHLAEGICISFVFFLKNAKKQK